MLRVDPHSQVPPSRQIVDGVLDALARGDVRAGERLPSVRQLARDALVNPNTVAKAYRELELLGVTEGRSGSGSFVTDAGFDIAVGRRLTATLEDYERGARAAIASGHAIEVLVERLEQLRDSRLGVQR